MKLSIVIPAFNEERTIGQILDKVSEVKLANPMEKEVVVVNDGSTDGTEMEVRRFMQDNPEFMVKCLCHHVNVGKGAAIRTGILECTGDYIVIQDADLEYDPDDYNLLLKPMVSGFADVVYGSRFKGGNPHRRLFALHAIGNKWLTFLSNVFTNLNLTDMETGYKLFRRDILRGMSLKENRFGFEPEVTAKLARIKGIRIYEVGISYYGRTYAEGKKTGLKDAINVLYCIFRYNLL